MEEVKIPAVLRGFFVVRLQHKTLVGRAKSASPFPRLSTARQKQSGYSRGDGKLFEFGCCHNDFVSHHLQESASRDKLARVEQAKGIGITFE